MKLKFTWGTGIFIVIVLFVSIFVTFIIYSFSHDINLVSKDYFPEEIAYESTLQKIKNSNTLEDKISFNQKNDELILEFPRGFLYNKIKGTIHFFYVSSYRKDKKLKIELNNSGKQIFSSKDFEKGRYTLKIDWFYKDIGYYQEIKITI